MYLVILAETQSLSSSDSYLTTLVFLLCMLTLIPVCVLVFNYFSENSTPYSKFVYDKKVKIKNPGFMVTDDVAEKMKYVSESLNQEYYFGDYLATTSPNKAIAFLVSTYGYSNKVDVQFLHVRRRMEIRLKHPDGCPPILILAEYDRGFGNGIRVIVNPKGPQRPPQVGVSQQYPY